MKCCFGRNLIITKTIAILFMTVPLQAMFYRAANRVTPVKSATSSFPKNVVQRIQIPQQRLPIEQKFMLPKKQNFNFQQPASSPKKSWSGLLAALGLGWLWYNPEDKERENEEKSEEAPTEKHISLNQFIKKFTPPKEIQETIEAHKDGLSPRRRKPYLIEGTQPPIYHKWDAIDRIINGELLREVIKQNNLDIEIPKEYLYSNPNNGKYEVFSQGMTVRPLGAEQLTLREIQALIKLTVESGYTDFNKDNVFRSPQNNKLIIVDTENNSFQTGLQPTSTSYQKVNVPKAVGVGSAIDRLNRNFKIDKDAQAWAVDYVKKLKDNDEGKERANLYTSRYNKLNISAQNAKELGQELYKQNQKQESSMAQTFWRIKHAIWLNK